MIVPDKYRSLFMRYSSVPPSYLQALAYRESNNDPRAVSSTGADGLFQITRGVREDFNAATGRSYTEPEMYDPAKCAEVAVWHLNQIQDAYVATDPQVFDLTYVQAWNDADYVGLVTLGYTAGWTPTQGVAYLVRKLLEAGVSVGDITVDRVIDEAQRRFPNSGIYVDPAQADPSTGRGPYMSAPFLRKHVHLVVEDYFDTAEHWRRGTGAGAKKKSSGWTWLLVAAGVGAYAYSRRDA